MPTNLLKKYNELLDLDQYNESERIVSLKAIFARDIENNSNFLFRNKQIHPIKTKGTEFDLQNLFSHLTTVKEEDTKTKKRIFESQRSRRLHWIKNHIDELNPTNIEVFSVEDSAGIRTYIYDEAEKYLIILEPRRKTYTDYYLITAYHIHQSGFLKNIQKKMERRLPVIY